MLKSKSVSNEAVIKISSKKIWPVFISQNVDYDTEELRLNQMINLSSGRFLQERDYSRNIRITESFHCAIGPFLSIAQVFGVFPIVGIRSLSPSKLHFKPFSFRVIYSIFIAGMIFFAMIIAAIHMFKALNAETFQTDGGIGAATAGVVFYGNSLLGTILFFWLSLRWKPLQCEWRAMEQYIGSNSLETPRLRWKFFLISFVILLLAFVEHALSILNNTREFEWNSSNSTFHSFLQLYSLQSHSFMFDTLEYNFSIGLFIFVVSKLATFVWNFTDLFIILVATGLAERYKSLNKKLINKVAKSRSRFHWHELRESYAVLSCVVKRVDDHISPIILLSFANNLYFICLQLLNGISYKLLRPHFMFLGLIMLVTSIHFYDKLRLSVLSNNTRPVHVGRLNDSNIFSTIYFFGSFAFLIGRACAVTLFTARIYDQSKKALPCLFNCSASSYNIEIQRLQHQLATDDVALTGLRFFSITRNFMLAVAGAITTYEVVLLQFNGNVRF